MMPTETSSGKVKADADDKKTNEISFFENHWKPPNNWQNDLEADERKNKAKE